METKNISLRHLLLPLLILQSVAALSVERPQNGVDLITQVCKKTNFYQLCMKSLQSDPRSSTADVNGLAGISLDLVTKKSNETFTYALELFKNVRDPLLYQYYGTCVEEYGAAVTRHLPAAIEALNKSHEYAVAGDEAKAVANNANVCEEQFTLTPMPRKSPFSSRSEVVHDLSLVAASIISQLKS
ncbi:pectinesterase inhibitor-like [Carica papaya]|uniref:pectinesterase inhibitor-like n=1 Tax=Carica papaya TaxID=3649 RepID=UPI000B8C934E|nr:pectinesterase inhibitor-like [Carica papaya]